MIDILIVIIGIVSGFLLFFNIPIISRRKFIKTEKDNKSLKISIVIPCRNEEKNIGELLDCLSKQTYPVFEVICVDDMSEDNTIDIIKSKKAKLIKIKNHPEGWLGKTYAVHTGAHSASGHVLLFLDADLKLENNAIETLVSAYNKHGTISVQPYHKMKKLYEQMALFFNLAAVGNTGIALPFPLQRGMFGPLIMINKKTYLQAGGHSPVMNCIVEDFKLGIHYQKMGINYKLFVGDKNIAFRMYPDGLKSQFEGFTKNMSTGILSSGILSAILTFLWISSIMVAPTNLIVSLVLGNYINIAIFGTSVALILVQLCFYSSRIGNFKYYLVLLYPLALLWFLIVIFYSFFRKIFIRTVVWKNRKNKI